MKRTTIQVGDHFIEMELHKHGWEVTSLKKSGLMFEDMWIEGTSELALERVRELAGELAVRAVSGE